MVLKRWRRDVHLGQIVALDRLPLNLLRVNDKVPASSIANHHVGRQPVLDGIRAVAILLVLLGHGLWSTALRTLGGFTGNAGVAVFFVLSGYLITTILLREEEISGRIDLWRFYKRRVLRIFPACYAFLIVLGIAEYFGIIAGDRSSWLASILYSRNLIGDDWATGHLWTLALEEQFYLLWPIAMTLIPSRSRFRTIVAVTLVACCWRAYVLKTSYHGGLYSRPDLRLDTFLIGAGFAIKRKTFVDSISAPFALSVLGVWLFFGQACYGEVDTPIQALLIGALVVWLVQSSQTGIGRFLSGRVPVTIGTVSYSVYLWQQLFLGPHLTWWSFPAIAMCSTLSYVLVEKPFMRLRNRITRVGDLPYFRTAVEVAMEEVPMRQTAITA